MAAACPEHPIAEIPGPAHEPWELPEEDWEFAEEEELDPDLFPDDPELPAEGEHEEATAR
jgi:hypothetical protein